MGLSWIDRVGRRLVVERTPAAIGFVLINTVDAAGQVQTTRVGKHRRRVRTKLTERRNLKRQLHRMHPPTLARLLGLKRR